MTWHDVGENYQNETWHRGAPIAPRCHVSLRFYWHVARHPAKDPAHRILFCRDPRRRAEEASTRFMFASDGVLSVGYGHCGPGVCLGDGQMKAEGVPCKVDAATRCSGVCPHTWPDVESSLETNTKGSSLETKTTNCTRQLGHTLLLFRRFRS